MLVFGAQVAVEELGGVAAEEDVDTSQPYRIWSTTPILLWLQQNLRDLHQIVELK